MTTLDAWFGAVGLSTVQGARSELVRVWSLRAQAWPQVQALAAGAQALRIAPATSVDELAGLAFELAVQLQLEPHTGALADYALWVRDQGGTGPSWITPAANITDHSVRWWVYHLAIMLIAPHNPDRQAGTLPGMLAAAAQLVSAPAWQIGRPADVATITNILRWLLEQSPLPANAAFTRTWLTRYGEIVNYKPPNVLDQVTQPIEDLLRWVYTNPGTTAGGGLAVVAAVAGGAFLVMNAPMLWAMARR